MIKNMTKNYKKILFVLENYYPKVGGVETLFKGICEELVNRGNMVKVLTTSAKSSKKFEKINGVEIERVNTSSRFLFTLFAIPKVFMDSKQYGLVHTSSYNAALPAFVGSKLRNKKIVITFHEVWGKLWFKLPFLNPVYKFLFYFYEKLILILPFDKYIAVSDFTEKKIEESGVKKRKIIRIYNGLDKVKDNTNKFENKPENKKEFKIIYFGRTGISKGLDILLKGFNLVKDKNIRLLLILPKEKNRIRRWIESYIAKNNLDNRVSVKDSLPRELLIEQIQKSDCAVFPSYSEGFGFSMLEASNLGLPVIISGGNSLEEIVSEKYIIIKEQTAKALTESILKAKKGEFSFKDKKEFLIKDCIEEYLRVYDELV